MLDSGQAHYKTVVPCIGLGSNFFGVLPLHNFQIVFYHNAYNILEYLHPFTTIITKSSLITLTPSLANIPHMFIDLPRRRSTQNQIRNRIPRNTNIRKTPTHMHPRIRQGNLGSSFSVAVLVDETFIS